MMTAEEFSDFISRGSEHLDDAIFKKVSPNDVWIRMAQGYEVGMLKGFGLEYRMVTGPRRHKWWLAREAVRKLAEGIAFVPS